MTTTPTTTSETEAALDRLHNIAQDVGAESLVEFYEGATPIRAEEKSAPQPAGESRGQRRDEMTLADLTREIRDIDRRLAAGSETPLWGRYLDRMREATGVWSPDPDGCGDVCVDDAEAEWWRSAYALYEERGGDFCDLQSMFDAVE